MLTRIVAALAAVLLTCAPAAAQLDTRTIPQAQPLTGAERMPAVQGSGCTAKTTPCASFAITPSLISTFLAPVFQPLDTDLTAIAALATTSTGRDLLTAADAAAIRSKAGLGTIATQAANGVAITGGTIAGITDLAVADGGTGASTAASARSNLGLASVAASGLDTDLTGTAWTSYTPTLSALSGTFTTAVTSGRYKRIGKTVFIQARVTITTNGSAAVAVVISLPFAAVGTGTSTDQWLLAGRAENSAQSYPMLQGVIASGGSTALILTYNNLYPGASGISLNVSGSYEGA